MGLTLVNDANCQTGNMAEWQSLQRDGINREMARARAAVVGWLLRLQEQNCSKEN